MFLFIFIIVIIILGNWLIILITFWCSGLSIGRRFWLLRSCLLILSWVWLYKVYLWYFNISQLINNFGCIGLCWVIINRSSWWLFDGKLFVIGFNCTCLGFFFLCFRLLGILVWWSIINILWLCRSIIFRVHIRLFDIYLFVISFDCTWFWVLFRWLVIYWLLLWWDTLIRDHLWLLCSCFVVISISSTCLNFILLAVNFTWIWIWLAIIC